MTLVRSCCCNPPIFCCGEWPTYCATPVPVLGTYWFYSLHRCLIHHSAEIEFQFNAAGLVLSGRYSGFTTAVDPDTQKLECSFPDPIGEFPYPVPMPGLQGAFVKPFNYPVPVFRGFTETLGEYEIVWPILQKCCIGESFEQLVIGFEVRGAPVIGKLVNALGTSPNSLTGLYNGIGRRWYPTSNGNFRFFGDPGTWSRDGLASGLPSFSPFRLGHDNSPTIISQTGPSAFTFKHTEWCKENGQGNACRCNFSFPEDPNCCEYYTAYLSFIVDTDDCQEHSVTTSCVMRRPPSPCPTGSGIDNTTIKTSLIRHPSTVPNGAYNVTKISPRNGCCVDFLPPNPAQGTGFNTPWVTAGVIGCDVTAADINCFDCDPNPQDMFDAVFCIRTGATLEADVPLSDPCSGTVATSQTWLIGVYMRNYGEGCCIDQYNVLRAFYMRDLNGVCVWTPLQDFVLTFECEL